MKQGFKLVIVAIFFASCSMLGLGGKKTTVTYYLDLSNPQDDLFHVTILVNGLAPENNIYHFAATAPGTYTNLDYGRFVKEFKAYDEEGNEISTEKISTNKWKISSPENVVKIHYSTEDTYEAASIFPMGGTDINTDHSHINTFGVFGYFEGLQSAPVKLKIETPSDWTTGTALNTDDKGYFVADTYDHLADSPILLGRLTKANLNVQGMDVEIYVYSSNDSIKAEMIKDASKAMLESARDFIGYNAAPRYTFLFNFLDQKTISESKFRGFGALEHSTSSSYVLPERSPKKAVPNSIDIMAHEFFHIVTPLNIHSEVIQTYNFSTPIASEHLWLYEGVTEWAAHMMQLRNQQITLEEYLKRTSQKITMDENYYDKEFSLSRLALESYEEEGGKQYGNIYQRGATVAGLLDIRLLELSNGKRGLREVLIELSKKYGKSHAFSEQGFFDDLVAMTYPEIRQFIDDYIRGTKEYPYANYYAKLGIKFTEERRAERPELGIGLNINDKGELYFMTLSNARKSDGLQIDDVLYKMFDEEVTMQNIRAMIPRVMELGIGGKVPVIVKRDGVEKEITLTLNVATDNNILEIDTEADSSAVSLRNIWLKNQAM